MTNRPAFVLLWAICCAPAVPAGAGVPAVIEIPSRAGAVTFAHTAHVAIGCRDCHHTSRGAVEQGCRACHTATATAARTSREAFHDACVGCHLKELKAGNTAGPAKRCSACHHRQADR
jgi:hypothetical protein